MNPMTDASIQPATKIYQQLQMNQCRGDPVYDEIPKCEEASAEYELVQMANVHTQQKQTAYLSPEWNQGHNDLLKANQNNSLTKLKQH